MVQDDNLTEIGQGYHALYHNIQVRRAYGFGVVSGGIVSPGSDGGASVDVSGGEAMYDGSVASIPSKTSLALGAPDDTNPRKDIIAHNGDDVVAVTGEPNPLASAQSTATRFQTYQPAPPDATSQEMVVLAEVWVPPAAGTIGADDINDLRTDPGIQTNEVTTDRTITAERPVVEVDAFGAEGDGETDDTDAIQRAIDSVTGTAVLAFSAGREYLVSSTIFVDVATIRGIAGRNARITPDADIDVFDISGSHDGTANPSGTTDDVQDNEMNPFVRNLRVGASDSDPKGTAITTTNTFGLRVEGCQLYNLTTAIRFRGNLRNPIINGNHIWHCLDYGIWYDDPDLHQSIIESNHISYCRKSIYVDCVTVECPDINIIGNSLEASSRPATAENIIHMRSDEWIEDVTIVGNLIEDHGDLTGPTILLEGISGINNFTRVVIAANGIGNSANADISLSNIKQVSVTGNSITDSNDYAVSIDGQVEALNISNNEVGVRIGTAPGFLRVDMDTFCGFWSITGNNATDCSNKPVVVNPDGTNNDRIFSLSFANNNFRDETGEGGYAVDFEGLDYLRETQIMNNSIRCDGATGGAMRIDAAENTLVIVKNNTARGVSGTDYDLPDSTQNDVVVTDNLST